MNFPHVSPFMLTVRLNIKIEYPDAIGFFGVAATMLAIVFLEIALLLSHRHDPLFPIRLALICLLKSVYAARQKYVQSARAS